MQSSLTLITPNWPAPDNIVAYSTTRAGGASTGRYATFNLGHHVGDDPSTVAYNRSLLPHSSEINWLEQVHGTECVKLENINTSPAKADASYTQCRRVGCSVMTADCLPVLLCDKSGKVVAAVHAGWRGLAYGVIKNTVASLPVAPSSLLAWLGPCIGAEHFEVGSDVLRHFQDCSHAFVARQQNDKYLMDLHAAARVKLEACGVTDVYSYQGCTYAQEDKFFSHRRATHHAETPTGRMVTVILMD
ncbi:peptidoglycan editing factor PgeF [Aestuariibacter salexigens]|uniref:peptidoglycan editing factor PgeF n=1 Tax=Aestuariibacter salexigens TaxID=226010 RepID=UPI000406A5E6|nr:peptidoglycan editing factor PgeF [Aestuariibacter salexigens]